MTIFDDASVVITGATGSFGQHCVREILNSCSPRRLIVFSRDELKQFEMQQKFDQPCMRYFLGDIRDLSRLRSAFEGVDFVIHAAALKQVPALEYNPGEAVKTNILGSENVVTAALEMRVKKVIALSTDKAAMPVNLYGATKLVADKIFTAANNIRGKHRTDFSLVRYGNVVGSRGSVIPLFKKIVNDGGSEIPITHPEMTRFFITLQQGVDFVLKAFERMHGGEIFIPKLPSVSILDLAKAIGPDLKTRVIGIRSGEKLHEVLCPSDLSHRVIEFDSFFIIKPQYIFAQEQDYSTNALNEKGTAVDEGFEYRSDNNPWCLNIKEICELLDPR